MLGLGLMLFLFKWFAMVYVVMSLELFMLYVVLFMMVFNLGYSYFVLLLGVLGSLFVLILLLSVVKTFNIDYTLF